jgi:hypothetical protein
MSNEAWAMMLLTWGVITGCTLYCFWKLMTSERDLSSDD